MKMSTEEFLEKEFNKERSRPTQFPQEVKDYLTDYAKQYNYPSEFTIKNIFMLIKNGIKEIPHCQLDGCQEKRNINKTNQLTEGCCVEHTRQVRNLIKYGVTNVSHRQDIKDKIKETCLKNNGGEYPMRSESVREKHKQTCLKKYGVENASSLPETQEKINKTNQERYGVNRPVQCEMFMEQMKDTNMIKYKSNYVLTSEHFKKVCREKYGVEHFNLNEKIQSKTKATNMERYGCESPAQSKIIKNKIRQANKTKYGTNTASQLQYVKEKMYATNLERYGNEIYFLSDSFLKNTNFFQYKQYKWKTGEISLVQGYEPIVLKELEESGYTYNEIVTDIKEVPVIPYIFEGNQHNYYPDFYIPKENKIIEVKSEWTLNLQYERNQAKFQATKNAGYNFDLEVR